MAVDFASFYAACSGIILTRDIEAALAGLSSGSSAATILAAVLPLVPEGNPPQYTAGAPPANPLVMPGASPVLAAALPPQPTVMLPIDGDAAHGTIATFAKGLPRFADSNPAPRDGWSIERNMPGAP